MQPAIGFTDRGTRRQVGFKRGRLTLDVGLTLSGPYIDVVIFEAYRAYFGEGNMMLRKLSAEFIGTAWLVLGGCGAAVLDAAFPQLGIGFVGVALAFGLTVLTMAYAIGHVSGCHLNPAVSLGLWAGGRFRTSELVPYIIAQVLGGIVGAACLYAIASGKAGFDVHAGFASNGYGDHSPGGYSLAAGLVCEVIMTFAFIFVIMGSTHGSAPRGFAPIAIGLCLTLIHQHVGEPGAQHGSGAVCRGLGARPALAVLGRAADRRGAGRRGLSLGRRRGASASGGFRRSGRALVMARHLAWLALLVAGLVVGGCGAR
jgi:aquaporin Z